MEIKKIILSAGIIETEEIEKWINLLLALRKPGIISPEIYAPYEIYDLFRNQTGCFEKDQALGCFLMAKSVITGCDNDRNDEYLKIRVFFCKNNMAYFSLDFDYSSAIKKITKKREKENETAKKSRSFFEGLKKFKPLIYEKTPEEEFAENEIKAKNNDLCFRIKDFYSNLNKATGVEDKTETTWTEAYKILKAISAGRFHRAVEIPKTEKRAEY
jgi:hypothetical protein